MRIVHIFLAFLIVISCIVSNFTIVNAQADETTENAEIVSVSNTQDINSYSAYMSQFSASNSSSADIVYDLNGIVLEDEPFEFDVNVVDSGLYGIGISYKALDVQMSTIRLGVKLDGNYPYSQAEQFKFPRMWMDEETEVRTDASGNEYAAQQVIYTDYYYNEAIDETLEHGEKFQFYLTEGTHKVSIVPVDGKLSVEYFTFTATSDCENYSMPNDTAQFYTGESIIIEGEDSKVKSSYFLVGKSDTSSTKVTPNSAVKNVINYVGGGNWKTVGETLVWETPELSAGYYQLAFSYRQNSMIGGKSYRTLTIDGKVPFFEAEKIGFPYDDSWQYRFFSDSKENPYYIYLSEGKHEIALSVTAGDIGKVRTKLTEAIAQLGDLYIDITKITGETVDIYRDYDLFTQIPEMEKRLIDIRTLLETSAKNLQEITGEKSGSNYSVIKNMVEAINQMLNNKSEAHRYRSYYYSNYCSVSSVLQDLRNMPLDIDKIALTAVGKKEPFPKNTPFEQMAFSVKRFFMSFSRDYNAVSNSDSKKDSVTIWVSWGRDQAQVLSSLVDRSFTPKTGIDVNLKLVNASVVQAVLSGNGPDCYLQMSRSEPVNLAMRGVLYNLSQFEDCDEVLGRFQDGAEIPYIYKGGLYALPDTQSYYVMFYRKDILEEYGLKVPTTWEEFDLVSKLLMRNNMNVYLPVNVATDVAQANVGVGSNNIYPSLLLQNNVSIYSEDGKKTNLLSADAMKVFEKWTDYYSKLKFSVSMDFYNRFRTGTTPIGINAYSLYTTLKVAAPEIEGLWAFTTIPGTVREDGTISHATSGGGTGCTIMKSAKNVDSAWEFLKWWTDADTQLTYSNDIESILGPTGRIALSNIEAIKGLTWDDGALDSLLSAWENVEEIPEYPGSYYVSRSIYQAFWNVVNDNKNTKDMLMEYGKEADDEIARKWKQYTDR